MVRVVGWSIATSFGGFLGCDVDFVSPRSGGRLPRSSTLDGLLPAAYEELRALACRFLDRERADHTLQPTALVHEAYLRLHRDRSLGGVDRDVFLLAAAHAMRRILVDHARRKSAAKRSPMDPSFTPELSESQWNQAALVVDVHEALEQLATVDRTMAQIVELRFFAGVTLEEIASTLGMSVRSVNRHWLLAKGWLYRAIRERQ